MDRMKPTSEIVVTPELVERFDIPGPRYTSYPTADRFMPDEWGAHLAHALGDRARTLGHTPFSLYIHLPFCASVCYYCACNKVITKDHGKVSEYLRYLEQEMDLVVPLIGSGRRQVAQLHLGGGSPTFLDDDELTHLMSLLAQRFELLPDMERSIEIDPRTVTPKRLAHLRTLGFNRVSFGVQDFDPRVQKAVHRVQPFEQVQSLVEEVRRLRFDSINLDLIYGLPYQTLESFRKTVDQVLTIQPDRIALYAYAHLPARFKPQRRIDAETLPAAATKVQMMDQAIHAFMAHGYDYIGMDHFALPEDQLAKVKRDGRLQRNFQGYHTHVGADLLGFGVSAISQVGQAYSQSVKTLETYYAALDAGKFPVERGLTLETDDLLRREVIMSLMCQGRIVFEPIERNYGIDFATYFRDALERLQEFEHEGLLTRTLAGLEVSKTGWFFVRPMAMSFDKYLWLHQDHQRFSKVL